MAPNESVDPEPLDPSDPTREAAGAGPLLPPEMPRSLTVLRGDDAPPRRVAPWREVTGSFVVPETVAHAADPVRHLLDEPELHFSPGLRRGTLALLPRRTALMRVVLEWEWSIDAATFSVHSFEPEPYTADERDALEAWLRATARRLQLFERALERAVARIDHDVVRGGDASSPESMRITDAPPVVAPGTVLRTATLGTRLALPPTHAAHRVVDVTLPDATDPGWEVFVDATTGDTLGYRRTLDEAGEARAFTYLVADHVDDVEPADLVDWHDQHIQRQLLVEDARQAYVHLLAGLEPPVSVQYTI